MKLLIFQGKLLFNSAARTLCLTSIIVIASLWRRNVDTHFKKEKKTAHHSQEVLNDPELPVHF